MTAPAIPRWRFTLVAAVVFAALLGAVAALITVMFWSLIRFVDTGWTGYALLVIAAAVALLTTERWLLRPLKFVGDRFLRLTPACEATSRRQHIKRTCRSHGPPPAGGIDTRKEHRARLPFR
ncbi:hypothetical protein ACT17_34285 [Mycolicibacterium conceptionense]|uniref:Transmembrane protein n=1 Tax=Mycolicibacterium conceptionense TaxID=451644 RepID=A0A0J8TW20_9MYCO|nr:hypothetical protein [Mycolicibacterium conceptionense]KMV13623.1 hypothetical protein ACT17_34285 [Mycolicibacterium conceptionense]